MAVRKQVRNQHTGAAGITGREADTLKICYRKITKISEKKNLFVTSKRKLQEIAQDIEYLLRTHQRW